MEKILQKEIREAISAGERAIESLETALESLNESSAWGVVDIIGGKLFTSVAKSAALKKTQTKLHNAIEDVDYFQRQLHDVTYFNLEEFNVSGVMIAFDIIADNIFFDGVVQAKIEKKKKEVKETIVKIEDIINKLHITLTEINDL